MAKSQNYKHWVSVFDSHRCPPCANEQGKIYELQEIPNPDAPMHDNCRCHIERMDALQAGTATSKKQNGADWWLKHYGTLPPYYISKTEALTAGWKKWKGNLASVAPGRWMAGGVYRNDDGHLPDAPGRVWYEADINYTTGFRGLERILYSNDGLIFITHDHYFTFIEVV